MSGTNNFMSNNITMSVAEIQGLLNTDIATIGLKSYHPKVIMRAGRPTKKALAYNRRLIREGKTTKYLDSSKFVRINPDGSTQVINKPVDRRYNDRRLKQSFTQKHNVVDNTFTTKKGETVFTYTPDEVLQVGWNIDIEEDPDDGIFSNDLMRYLVRTNDFSGNYRILIQKNGENIFDREFDISGSPNAWWKANKMAFMVDSAFMVWNYDLEEGDRIQIIFTKEKRLSNKYYLQTYLDGTVSHCLLQPIIDWAKETLENAVSKSTAKKYTAIINKIVGKKGKDGLLDKYKHGVPEKDIPSLCEELQIGMDIEQPFNRDLLFEYRSMKRPLKVFRFINTRLNHVECATNKKYNDESIFNNGGSNIINERKTLIKMKEQLEKDKEFFIYKKDQWGISGIQTLTDSYKLYNEFSETVKEWEKDQGLNYCSIESVSNPELMKFINAGTHFNGTIDFQDQEIIFEYKSIFKRPKNLKHIDMSKAYTQYKSCRWYNKFMMKITDFRETDKYYDNGLYQIDLIDLSNCDHKFQMYNIHLGWFEDDNVYTSAELKALEHYGGKFRVRYGCWGIDGEFTFSDDMINKKCITMFEDNEFSVPYYSKWAGMNCMIKESKNFWCKGDEKFFSNIHSDADIYWANDEARISYPVKYHFNKKHITAQITAYQRLHMLEQLMNMDEEKIVRICCDGIYYYDHEYDICEVFTHKEKMTFNNSPCEKYLSSIINDGSTYFKCDNVFRENYRSEIFDSAGGDGKTYRNLFLDQGFINVVYAPHSNKLESRMKKDYHDHFGKRLMVSNHSRLLTEPFSKVEGEVYKYNVYIIDECSMLTEKQKDYLLENITGKVIFCGDLACQCLPIDSGKQMTHKNISHVADPSPVNYRFKSDKQLQACNYVRECINKKKVVKKDQLPYKTISKEDVKKMYNKEDIILVSRHCFNDEWTEVFKDLEKYKVKNNTRDYNNGDIIFQKVSKVQTELRHGYTIHSVQGETFKNKIFIDMRKMSDLRMFYTAISRAEYDTQIYLIREKEKKYDVKKYCKKYNGEIKINADYEKWD